MKKIAFLFFASFVSASLFAQLENTRWKATITIDGPVNVIFDFKKEAVAIYALADSTLIESMAYTHDDTSFTLQKIEGQSDCGDQDPGKYGYTIEHGTMHLKMITDDCYDRSSVLNETQWALWKEPVAVQVDEAILKQYIGVYQLDEAHPIRITLADGILYAEGRNNKLPISPLTAMGNDKFFLRIAGVAWDFIKDDNGKVIELISHEEKDYELKKVR